MTDDAMTRYVCFDPDSDEFEVALSALCGLGLVMTLTFVNGAYCGAIPIAIVEHRLLYHSWDPDFGPGRTTELLSLGSLMGLRVH
jgi:hypothetical protein